MELTGKILKIYEPTRGVSKANKPWCKQDFVIETEEQYPRKIFMSVMGDELLSTLENYREGFKVTASINIESREYNERWYTEIKAWRIAGDESNKQNTSDNSSLPF